MLSIYKIMGHQYFAISVYMLTHYIDRKMLFYDDQIKRNIEWKSHVKFETKASRWKVRLRVLNASFIFSKQALELSTESKLDCV